METETPITIGDGVTLILKERIRQDSVDNYASGNWNHHWIENNIWPDVQDPIKNLVRAGALIAAEIDRLQRQAKKSV